VERAEIRRALGWALVGALTVAAVTAIGALLTGDFHDTEWRVLGTSFGFAFLSATAAAGSSARLRPSKTLRTVGGLTAVASGLTFVLLAAGLWTDLLDDEATWRAWGCLLILTVAGSHACLVLMARRPTDGDAVRLLVTVSLTAAAIDAFFGLLPVSGIVGDEVDEGFAELIAVLVVVLLFSTLVPPILRRLQRSSPAPRGFAGEVMAIADRIDELGRGPGLRTPEIRRETERLRRLARDESA
jgi:hypothetical protein